jgi:hypothetical protein
LASTESAERASRSQAIWLSAAGVGVASEFGLIGYIIYEVLDKASGNDDDQVEE